MQLGACWCGVYRCQEVAAERLVSVSRERDDLQVCCRKSPACVSAGKERLDSHCSGGGVLRQLGAADAEPLAH